ncbi:MAG: hypothetical protein ACTSRC_13230 [Candidatus Helarchaeota archaeon]
MPKTIDELAGEIMSEMEKLLLERVYIGIIKEGELLYASTALDKHIELLKLFNITEFKDMPLLGHAFPLAGTNLAIFKLGEIMVAIYIKKGYQGQLLSFKTKINKYLKEFQELAKVPMRKGPEVEAKGQILPILVETVSLTLGVSEDESSVLKLCNGNHSIKEIIDKTRIPRKKVVDIIRQFENKGWLKLDFQGEVDIIPISIKKFPETAVRLGMISKKSYDINELCDGTHTIKEIADKMIMSEKELKKILQKMEKNKIIKMTVKIPEKEEAVVESPVEMVEQPTDEAAPYPELNLKPKLAANVSFSMGFDDIEQRILTLLDGTHTIDDIFAVTQIPILDIFKIIIKYEEKGWIRIPIDDFIHIVSIKDKLKSPYQVQELEEKYRKYLEERGTALISTVQSTIYTPTVPPAEMEGVREALISRIQVELPLIPEAALNKVVEKLLKSPAQSREGILQKLFTSPASDKFRRKEEKQVPATPVSPSALTPSSVPTPTSVPSTPSTLTPTLTPPPHLPSTQPQTAPAAPPPIQQPQPSSQPVIDETPLLRPSEILKREQVRKEPPPPEKELLLSPESFETPQLESLRDKILNLGEEIPTSQSEGASSLAPTQETDSKPLPTEGEQVNEVLEFIDSLLGIPEILYLALIDYSGTIFYQTTKETELWDITKDVLKMIQNWNAQAPSIYLGGIKFATIKATPDAMIATNIKGLGHVVSIKVNENLFIFTKVSKEGDTLLISDDIAIVAKQINQMF